MVDPTQGRHEEEAQALHSVMKHSHPQALLFHMICYKKPHFLSPRFTLRLPRRQPRVIYSLKTFVDTLPSDRTLSRGQQTDLAARYWVLESQDQRSSSRAGVASRYA